jgi:hypothetical protein
VSRRRKDPLAIAPGRTPERGSHAKFNENAPLTHTEEHALALLFRAVELTMPDSSVSRLRARRFELPDGRGGSALGDLVQTNIERDQNRVRCVFAMLDGRAMEFTLQLSSDEFAFIQARPGRFSTAKH